MINDVTPPRKPSAPNGVKSPPGSNPNENVKSTEISLKSVVATTPKEPTKAVSGKGSGDDGTKAAFKELFSTVGILLTALAVALLMIAFVFRSYQVDGPSMENTLQNYDKLIIWKVPRTWSDVTHHAYIPDRGDIIVFTESGLSQFGQTDTKQLIKRVIGLPGDRVVVSNGSYTIYNKAHPKGFDPDKTMGYFKSGQIPVTSGDINVTLGPNQIFVSGDNRPNSLDSRAFGPINANQVVGKLILRVYPFDTAKVF
jgi:signal peptidase I